MVEDVPQYSSSKKSAFEWDWTNTTTLKWCGVSLSEVIATGKRLEGSVFDPDGKRARKLVETGKYPYQHITGDDGLASAYTYGRFKRIWVPKSEYPIYQPSTIMDQMPGPDGYISGKTDTDINSLRVHLKQVLLTCSGTIGNVSLVSKTLDNQIFSHDLIRITCHDPSDSGYIYTYLKSKIGNKILLTNQYGAVVSHIEANHLDNIIIPNPGDNIKNVISNLINKSFQLRDEANELLESATSLLYDELALVSFEKEMEDNRCPINVFEVKISDAQKRFDASHHMPIYKKIVQHLEKHSKNIVNIGDEIISKKIFLPDRFKRVYVDEGYGIVFFSGKDILQLDPSNKKYLSKKHYDQKLIDELILRKNMIVITRSGTIGNIALVPNHWDGWSMSDDIIRLISKEGIEGYLYIWLNSKYGKMLLTSSSYGAVVSHIEVEHVSSVKVPLLKNISIQSKINDMAIKANDKRYEAYLLEQQALKMMDEEVLGLE